MAKKEETPAEGHKSAVELEKESGHASELHAHESKPNLHAESTISAEAIVFDVAAVNTALLADPNIAKLPGATIKYMYTATVNFNGEFFPFIIDDQATLTGTGTPLYATPVALATAIGTAVYTRDRTN